MEKKSYFYDGSQIALQLSRIDAISKKYYAKAIPNLIEVGNKTFEDEFVSLNDDFLTQNTFSVDSIKKTKNKLDLLSTFTASPYSIESQRVNQYSADSGKTGIKLDDTNFIISVIKNKINLNVTEFKNSGNRIAISNEGEAVFNFLTDIVFFDLVVTYSSNNGTFVVLML